MASKQLSRTTSYELLFIMASVLCLFQTVDGNEVDEYITSIIDLLREIGPGMAWQEHNRLERLERMWEEHCRVFAVLVVIVEAAQGFNNLKVQLADIYREMGNLLQFFQNHLEPLPRSADTHFQTELLLTGQSGRPRYDISKEQVEQLRATGMKWTHIADCLNVSIRTLHRHRLRLGIPADPYTVIDDDALDQQITQILRLTPEVGETYVIGALRGRGIITQRSRIRERLNFLDPISRDIRRRRPIFRRTYNVTVPNKLWYVLYQH